MRRASILGILLVLAAAARAADPTPPGSLPQRFEKYVEEIPRYLIKLEMVPVKGGKFTMAPLAGKGEAKEVAVDDFWMLTTEVPWEAFEAWMDRRWMTEAEERAWTAQPSQLRMPPRMSVENPDRGFGRGRHPVLSLTRESAEGYCKWLSQRTGRMYRLPTEAEFEWAIVSGGGVEWGDAEQPPKVAWCKENAADAEFESGRTHPVGMLPANKLGLHDLLGNVAEHCTPLDDSRMVVRGGSYKTAAARFAPGFRARATIALFVADMGW